MKEIERLLVSVGFFKGNAHATMKEFDYGDYAKYTDHKAIVETMQKRIDKI